MKRGHTVLEYKSKIRRLRAIRPSISLSSDFIIGFPGETDADFEQTMGLIEEIGFDHSFSFIFSARPGTLQQISRRYADGGQKGSTRAASGTDQSQAW